MTVLEITHSRPWAEIAKLVSIMDPKMAEITNYTHAHRTRLIKPLLSYDNAAIALSFLPAAGESILPSAERSKLEHDGDNKYTYHHFRRDLYDLCQTTGVEVASRYVVPSAHLTIARFVNQDIFEEGRVSELVGEIEGINEELKRDLWPSCCGNAGTEALLQWVVGEEKGLVCRKATVWYGGGESHCEGKGFLVG